MTAGNQAPIRYAVVIPTVGRESLRTAVSAVDGSAGPAPEEVVVVDDRIAPEPRLSLPETEFPVRIRHSYGQGPAGARNVGWRSVHTDWVIFLDDDVLPRADWRQMLAKDLDVGPEVAACQGRIVVPLPDHRKPTDLERGTAGLSRAWWITADIAYRREVLALANGFDERFRHAYREDADLAVRVQSLGYRLVIGSRRTEHPVRPAGFFASVSAQAGNSDDALIRRKHGRYWRPRIGEGRGRIRRHVLTTAAAATALGAVAGPRRPVWRRTSLAAAVVWSAMTTEFALRRIVLGPRTPAEVARMLVTSVVIPPVACFHRLRGEIHCVRLPRRRASAVLFDRDDTLIEDVPYNSDPSRVRPVNGTRDALDRLRANGIQIGVVTNQSGVARGYVRPDELDAVHAEVERQLGPFGTWQVCAHHTHDGCECRKPEPGLIHQAAAELHVLPESCVVIGDTGADIDAALAAGARPILVPTTRTCPSEIRQARKRAEVAASVSQAVDRILEGW